MSTGQCIGGCFRVSQGGFLCDIIKPRVWSEVGGGVGGWRAAGEGSVLGGVRGAG